MSMRLANQMKRFVALCLLGGWFLMLGIAVSEAFGYFEDTPEHADQSFEQVLLTPAEAATHLTAPLHPEPTPFGPLRISFEEAKSLITPFACFTSLDSRGLGPPLPTHFRLFQLFSVYRL